MSAALKEITALHPCFSAGIPNNKGRIHLPVSPACNIECRFCKRSINITEDRPAVTARIVTPREAVNIVDKSLQISGNLSVVGIAGPGDTLATPHALQTFRLVGDKFPDLLKCMSTNGLLLADKAAELIEAGIDTLTVTVNEIYPESLSRLCGRVIYKGKVYFGEKGAALLIQNQLEGIKLVSQAGITVKVNTVLVPEINGGHIGEIAMKVKEAGASLYNIIPLIPQHELAACSAPTCAEIDRARSKAEEYITVFRHCQHCRADAIGVPGGRDYGERIYLERMRQDTFSHG